MKAMNGREKLDPSPFLCFCFVVVCVYREDERSKE